MESQSHHCSKLDFNNNGNAQVKARALSALATLYQAQSKYSAAIKLHEPQAVTLACGIIKPNDKSPNLCLADSVTGYAEALQKSGDLAGAETYHREALKTQTRAIEEDLCTDPELAISYTQLGCTLSEMEDFEESHKLHTLALKLWYKHLDIYHGLVSESLSYCAESLYRGVDAIPLAFHSVQTRRGVFGESHPAFAHAMSVLASCYHAVRRHTDARCSIEKCLQICKTAFHDNNANLVPNLIIYGDVLPCMGEFREIANLFHVDQDSQMIHRKNVLIRS
ncbi:hypothetical protein ACHAXN_000382 [Cyclotella atomus]